MKNIKKISIIIFSLFVCLFVMLQFESNRVRANISIADEHDTRYTYTDQQVYKVRKLGTGKSTIHYITSQSEIYVDYTGNGYMSSPSDKLDHIGDLLIYDMYTFKWCRNTYSSSSTCDNTGIDSSKYDERGLIGRNGYHFLGYKREYGGINKRSFIIEAPTVSEDMELYLWLRGNAYGSSVGYFTSDEDIESNSSSSSNPRVFKFYIDDTAPTMSLSGTSTSYAKSRNITVSFSDLESGAFSVSCNFELLPTLHYNASFNLITSSTYVCTYTNTKKTGNIAVMDKSGNIAYVTANIYVDATAPNINLSSSTMYDSHTFVALPDEDITITIKDNITLSSAVIKYCWSTTTSCDAFTISPIPYSALTNAPETTGYYYLIVDTVSDGVGNQSNLVARYYVSNNAYTFKSVSTYETTINMLDMFVSGIEGVEQDYFKFLVDDENFEYLITIGYMSPNQGYGDRFNLYKSFKFKGTSYIYSYQLPRNNFGNSSWFRILINGVSMGFSIRVYFDDDLPSLSVTGTSTVWTKNNRSIVLNASDKTTGIQKYYCNGTWVDSVSTSYTCVISNTAKYVDVGVMDSTGNTTIETVPAFVDKTSPTVSNEYSYFKGSLLFLLYNSIDEHSGIDTYSCDGGSTWGNYSFCSYSNPSQVSSVTLGVKDNVGNIAVLTIEHDFREEGLLEGMTGAGESTEWINTDRTIVITPTDSTFIWKYYCNSTWVESSEPTYSCVFSTTTKTATIGGLDHSGVERLITVDVYVDKTNPKISTVGESTEWTIVDRTITLSGSDDHSGVAAYSCDGTTWNASTSNNYDCKFTQTTKTATVGVKDRAGNILTKTINVYVDKTNPKISTSGESTEWTKSNRTITVTGSDDHSGVAAYSCDGTTWISSTSSSHGCQYTQTTRTATVGVKDRVGNISTKTVNVYVDKTKPYGTITKEFTTAQIDLINSKFYIPFTPGDSHSGVKTLTVTNSGTFDTDKIWFPISSIDNQSITFVYKITDKVGNVLEVTETIDVTVSYDDVLSAQIKAGIQQKIDTGRTLASRNNGNQLSYTLDDDVATIISNMGPFGIDLNSDLIDLRYLFISNETNGDLGLYKGISRHTSIYIIADELVTPLGQKQKQNQKISLILFFEDLSILVATGTITPTSMAVLSTTFDTYENVETNYVGAGLGNDGTVVSFSDDVTSSMAVTLGTNNKIEKRDVYGVLEWEKAITSSGKVELKKVINNEYGILVLGETTSGSINGTSYPLMGGKDILVIRLDKQGNILFTNVIGTKYEDDVISADMIENKIAILTSNEESSIVYTMNIDGSNVNETIAAGVGIHPNNVALIGNRMVITGSVVQETMVVGENGSISPKTAYIQLFEDGLLSWTRILGASTDVSFYSVDLDNNNIYIVGQSDSVVLHDNLGNTKIVDSYGNKDGMIIKYDYLGNMLQLSFIGGVGDDTFNQILVSNSKVIVAGTTTSEEVTASHYMNNNYRINKIDETDALIITLNKSLIIEDGLNLSYEEGVELQEIGINQYTEQLMILSSSGVHTQKVVDDTLEFEVLYKDGMLSIKANEEIVSATLYDGTHYYDIGEGIEVPYGAYEVKVVSVTGQTIVQVVGFEPETIDHSILPMLAMFASIATLGILTILVIKKYKKEYVIA